MGNISIAATSVTRLQSPNPLSKEILVIGIFADNHII